MKPQYIKFAIPIIILFESRALIIQSVTDALSMRSLEWEGWGRG